MAFISSPRYRQFQPPVIAPGLINPDAEDDEFLGAPPIPPPGPNAQAVEMPMRPAATPALPPQQLTNAQAGVSSMPLAPLNGGGPRQPPPNPYRAQATTPASTVPPATPPIQQGPPPNPNAAPVLGALDNQVATSDSDANISPQAPPVDTRAPIADQLAEKRQELVSHDQGVKSNIMQRIALAALAMTRFSPMAPFLVHPKASLERANLTNQIADLEGAQANEYKEAQIEAEKQHGNYWENRSLQERNRFKFDPKTGAMYDMATGQITQQPKSLQDHIAEYTAAGFSPQDARSLATGQKLTPMTALPDKLADNLGLPHGFEMPTEHIATLIGAANRPAPNKTEAQLALDANNPDPQIAAPAKAALGLLLKNREAIKLTVNPVMGGGNGSIISSDALDMAANMYLKTGNLPAMGMGSSGAVARAAVLNRAAAISKNNGVTPDPAANKAIYGGLNRSLSQLQNMYGLTTAFEHNTAANMQLLRKASVDTDPTGSPLINKYRLALKNNVFGDPAAARLRDAVKTVANEVAKIRSGSNTGAATDTARREAEDSLNEAMTNGQIDAVLNQMEQEMTNRRETLSQQIEETRGNIRAIGTSGNGGSATVTMQAPDGTTRQVPSDQVEHYKSRGAKVVQ